MRAHSRSRARRSILGRFPVAALVLAGSWWALPAAAQFDGAWKGRFAGVGLDVQGDEAVLYQVSESFAWRLDGFRFDADGVFGTGDGRRFRLVEREGRLDMLDDRDEVFLSFEPTATLPPTVAPTTDPETVFDVFWESFAENHALFELAGVDWAAQRDAWRNQAAAAAGPSALFDLMAGWLAPLNDRHTTLVRPESGRIYRSGRDSDPFWRGKENEFLNNIAQAYLGAPLQTRGADPRLRFGWLPDNIAYLSVSNFLDSGSLPPFATTLDLVLAELEGAEGLVVDLRFNPGGVDRNTLAFLERILPPERTLAWARERRLTGPLPAAFDAPVFQPLAPRDNPFHDRPLVLLTGNDTASAAETVLLALMEAPRAVQVGETSAGVFSNLLVRYFPNGWYSTLSNERFYSLDGVSYEQRGIPPQVPVDRAGYDFVTGVDPAVDAAVTAVRSQPRHVDAPVSPGESITGLWYDPARSGEGWHLQRVDEDRVFVTFYGFDPDGSGRQDWVVGLGEERDGVLVLDELLTALGGRFGAGPEDTPIDTVPWGRGEIRFEDCHAAVASLAGPDSHRGFVFRLRRLSRVPGLGCDAPGVVAATSPAGSWYVPERPGEGWLVSPTGPDEYVVSWYTFDEAGNRRWAIGTGALGENGLTVAPIRIAAGPDYGHDFRAGDLRLDELGTLVMRLRDCRNADIVLTRPGASPVPLFPVRRLTRVQGLAYPEGCG